MSLPIHQRVVYALVAIAAVLLAFGSFLSTIRNTNALISTPIAIVGTVILVGGLTVGQIYIRRHPIPWVFKGQLVRVKNFGPVSMASVIALTALLWIPTLYATFIIPPDRTTIQWGERLWGGEVMTVEIGDLPAHARGGLLVEGRSYSVRYQQKPCMWFSSGPAKQHTGEVVEAHANTAGMTVQPHLDRTNSGTSTAECNSPRENKLVVLGMPVDFDRRGNLSFGGAWNHVGQIRLP